MRLSQGERFCMEKNLLSALRSFQVLEEFMVRRTWCATAVNIYRRPEETEGGQKMEQRCCGFMDSASFFSVGLLMCLKMLWRTSRFPTVGKVVICSDSSASCSELIPYM